MKCVFDLQVWPHPWSRCRTSGRDCLSIQTMSYSGHSWNLKLFLLLIQSSRFMLTRCSNLGWGPVCFQDQTMDVKRTLSHNCVVLSSARGPWEAWSWLATRRGWVLHDWKFQVYSVWDVDSAGVGIQPFFSELRCNHYAACNFYPTLWQSSRRSGTLVTSSKPTRKSSCLYSAIRFLIWRHLLTGLKVWSTGPFNRSHCWMWVRPLPSVRFRR